ncbi:hypothetical protein CHS0354_035243 [Potamilus streckersoni]|uniref:RecF/RecN/SMC N-terminal domain-containing protein n=1 Tax=Potamilus streckersoni TaxID=2493646 RepID=A0AAE0VP99_9BIVA|nr:hypothetical protein CHS0354_035243 [Potamilus streckersoni]
MLAGIAVFSSGTRASHISQSLKTPVSAPSQFILLTARKVPPQNPLSAYLIARTAQPIAVPLLKRIICTTDGTQLPSRSHTDIPLFHFNSDTLLTESNGLVRFINPDADPAHTLREQTRRRLSDIPAQTDTLNRHIDSCEVKLAMLRADCDEQQDMQTRVSEELKIISLKLSEARIEKDILKKQYEEQRRRQDQEAKRYTELTQKQAQTLNQTEETARLIAQLNAEADVLTAQHQSDNDTLSNTVERNAQQETDYQELRLQLQEFKNIRSRTAETTARLQADIKEITQKLEDARSGYQKKFTGASEELTSIEKLRAEIPVLLSSYEESAGEAVAQKNTVELKKQEILQAEKDKNIFFEKINRSEKQKQTFSLQLAETTKEMNLTEERLREASGFFPKEVLKSTRPEEFDLSAASRELEEQKEILREIGNINMEAFDEYKTLKERLGFLTGQQKDLTDSISALETSIEQLDAETEAKFQETFARINQNLQTVFPLFFGGGNAKLIMVQDNEDNSKRGIEITALIPGKKLQNMNLMSGGEKALCALALIFAVFLIKPAPFCVLDEVDAPLDEANVKRFSNVLSEFSQKTRFVIITHNKVTMTVADCLLGVTMGEPGVSKIVSVRVSDYVSTPSAVA